MTKPLNDDPFNALDSIVWDQLTGQVAAELTGQVSGRTPTLTLRLPANPTNFETAWFTAANHTATALYGPPSRIRIWLRPRRWFRR